MIRVEVGSSFASFREKARHLLARDIAPERVVFDEASAAQATLLAGQGELPQATVPARPVPSVPRGFVALAETVALHRDAIRWPALYRVLWRLTHGEHHLLHVESDRDVYRLLQMQKAVRVDLHKMHAFVRFRRVEREGVEHFIAWHRPDHLIVRAAAPFFARRFPSMRWSILTPDESAHWDLEALRFTPGVPASEAPQDDALEDVWRAYYASVFNPARLNVKAMNAQLFRRHWATLPEARLIPELVREAPERTRKMVTPKFEFSAAAEVLPQARDLESLRQAARGCQACPLFARATQTVFGEGDRSARLMLVGEQPGDQEDREGHPFIGPAGALLDEVLAQVGLDRSELYVTNAVKHFSWTGGEGPTRRIHQKPTRAEVIACKGWLEAEVSAVKPRMILALGATAAQSFLGTGFRINLSRGQVFETPWAAWWMATFHPSALLRMPDEKARAQARLHFIEDLRVAARALRERTPGG